MKRKFEKTLSRVTSRGQFSSVYIFCQSKIHVNLINRKMVNLQGRPEETNTKPTIHRIKKKYIYFRENKSITK